MARTTFKWFVPALLFAAIALTLCASPEARGQADEQANAAQRLRSLLKMAPNRQVGQAGNDAVDAWVRDLFANHAQAHNADRSRAARWAEARTAIEAAADADARVWDTKAKREQLTQSAQVADSPWHVRFTLEQTGPTVAILLVLALLFFAGWRVQKRTGLLVAVVCALVLSALLPIVAALVKTEAESVAGDGTDTKSTAQLDMAVVAAANAALAADREAARSLEGLWQHGRIHFPSAAFVPGDAELTVLTEAKETAAALPLFQMAPNMAEAANLGPNGFEGPLVSIGRVRPSDLDGKDLSGAAVLVDFDCGKRWLDAIALGARIVLVLEPDTQRGITYTEAAQKRTETLLSVPRFYVRRADFDQVFGAALSTAPRVRIEQPQRGRFEARRLAIDWLFIPGTEPPRPANARFEEDPARQLVHIQAYKDSRSVVPALSPGASSAANLVLLADLVNHFAEHPPRRPVLLSAVNDHTNALAGEQHYAFTAFAEPGAVLEEIQHLEQEMARHRFIQEAYGRAPDGERIETIRVQTAFAGGQVVKLRTPAQTRLTELRNALRERRNAIQFELKEQALSDEQIEQRHAQLDQIETDVLQLVRLMGLFNRFGRKTYFDEAAAQKWGGSSAHHLTGDEQQRVGELFEDIREHARMIADLREASLRQLQANMAIRRRLRRITADGGEPAQAEEAAADFATVFAQRHAPLPVITTISLDLSFGTSQMGLFHIGHLTRPMGNDEELARGRVQRLAVRAVRTAVSHAEEAGISNPLVDTIRNVGGTDWRSHLGHSIALGSRPVHRYTRPGLTITGVRDQRVHAYTPHDTIDRIDTENFDSLMSFARGFLPRFVNSHGLGLTRLQRGDPTPLSLRFDVRLLDKYSSNVSQTPLPNAIVVMHRGDQFLPDQAYMLGQVRPWMMLMADATGSAVVRGGMWRGASPQVYGVDPDTGKLNAAVDMSAAAVQFNLKLAVPTQVAFAPAYAIAFEARKVDLVNTTEPLSLGPAAYVEGIDAAMEATPRHFSVNGVGVLIRAKSTLTTLDGTASIWVEPRSRIKLRMGLALAINATQKKDKGLGFGPEDDMLNEVVLQSAQDMWRINHGRLEQLKTKGVVNDSADYLSSTARQQIDAARVAAGEQRHNEARAHAQRAQGLAYKAYVRGKGTINDLIKAVILFLMLVIPFCYFLMKLITPFTDINRQIALFVGIFVGMALLLQAVHPAFAVAKTPSMVLLAFVIIGLAGFVAVILISRFNESMTQAVEEHQRSESAEAPRSRLAGVAFVVGVSNMKRRRIRTTLTCATVVLVTFTMLSVISVGQDMDPAQRRLGRGSPYDGWVYVRPGLRPLNDLQVQRLRAQIPNAAQSVARAWLERKSAFEEYLSFQVRPTRPVPGAPEPALQAQMLLGLETSEDGFIAPMPLLPGGRWFSSNEADEIVLSAKAGRFLGITPSNLKGTTVMLASRELELVGLLDDEKLEALRDVGDVPLLPLMSEPSFEKQQRSQEEMNLDSEASGAALMAEGGGILSTPGVQLSEAKNIAILPIDLLFELGKAEHRSLSFKYGGAAAARAAWLDANDLISFQHARLAVGLTEPVVLEEQGRTVDGGQYALASSSTTEVAGILKIAIPIFLAATIILNTMLGSVMERKREVGIYNAIGLNPGHVMMFFLAESLVFGVVGSVAGYVIGQGLSLLLPRSMGLNLNYSSLSVMVVILLSIGTVLISTIYPAAMAARAAVPSGQRRWSLPQPQGDQIHVDFPFSYDAERVLGVCAYLDEFMQQNTEASTGKFLARPGPVGRVPMATPGGDGAANGAAYAMVYDIAPVPFDLGVNQKMEVYAYYNTRVRAHMLSVHLTRRSGQVHNWVHVNQPFLEALRKRLLSWRSQRPQNQQSYYENGQGMFEDAKQLPTASEALA